MIIGGRYGSTTPEGVSYTEKEYDYAIERGLKVLAFVHEDPAAIPVGKSDIDPELRGRLAAFREKVMSGRLVKLWKTADELPGLVALSLSKTMKTYPAVGWVRANQVANTDVLAEVNELRKHNQELERLVTQLSSAAVEPSVQNLAGLDEKVSISGTHWYGHTKYKWDCALTWAEVFGLIAPYLLHHPNDEYVKAVYTSGLHQKTGRSATSITLEDQDFQTIKIQLMALGLVDLKYAQTTKGGTALFWSLTPQGHAQLLQIRTVKATGGG